MRKPIVILAVILGLSAAARAKGAMYVIENPASKISNPADQITNPAAQTNNPASNIYNPGSRMDNPNPLAAPTPHPPESSAKVPAASAPSRSAEAQKRYRPQPPQKKYYFTSAAAYIAAAKKSFVKDDYLEFLSITEDALRRIRAGTLKASSGIKHKLQNYQLFGYGLLE